MSLYLDYNASAPVLKEVLEAMIYAYTHVTGNADSRTHNFGTNAQKYVQDCRTQIASILGRCGLTLPSSCLPAARPKAIIWPSWVWPTGPEQTIRPILSRRL